MSSAFGDQKSNGEYKKWRSNGQLWLHTFYKNGKLDGECKAWHPNGRLQVHSFYKNGRTNGEYKRWHYNSQIELDHYYYRNGVILDKKFTIHKKHIWVRYFNRLKYRINLRRLAVILDRLLILDLIKICAKY